MRERAPKLAAGLGCLAVLWIGVYWWWPASEPPVSFDPPKVTEPQPDAPIAKADPPSVVSPPAPVPVRTDPPRSQDPPRETTPVPKVEPKPQPTPAVIPPEFSDYIIVSGDSLASISRKYFGTEKHASAIARANPLMDPNRLRPGRTIRVPKDPSNIQGKPVEPPPAPPGDSGAEREYTVRSGDTLSRIAGAMYGDSQLATFIFEANRDQLDDEHTLRLGQKLRIPPKPRQ